MATHSSILAWRILWTEEPGGLLSIGSHRVGHNWRVLACMHVLEKEMATHSSILAWRILWTEEPGGLLFIGSHRVGHNWSVLACMDALEKETENPLQCSCLENPRDRGAWWAAIYGVAQSRTRLKRLSSSSSIHSPSCRHEIVYILILF